MLVRLPRMKKIELFYLNTSTKPRLSKPKLWSQNAVDQLFTDVCFETVDAVKRLNSVTDILI